MDKMLNPPAIHGPVVPGVAVQARKELETVISVANSSMFDIAELLHKIKKNKYHDGTFTDYLKSLNFKRRRLEYLEKMAGVMEAVGIPRTQYEPLGISKLREITSLDPNGKWTDPETKEEIPISTFIQGFVEKGHELSKEDIHKHVNTLKGMIGEESMGWIHLYMKQSVIDQVVKPSLEKAKALIGSIGKDEEGYSIDPSDGRAAETVFVSFLTTEIGNE